MRRLFIRAPALPSVLLNDIKHRTDGKAGARMPGTNRAEGNLTRFPKVLLCQMTECECAISIPPAIAFCPRGNHRLGESIGRI